MNTLVSRFLLAGGQNAVPVSGWFLAGWSPGTTLALFWFENLVLTVFIAARVAVHWRATHTRGHLNGFLQNFLITSLVFTVAHGLFLGLFLSSVLANTVERDHLVAGVQWMLGAQVVSLLLDLWSIGRWPFAEVRARTDWMLGRVVAVHLSILFGMLLFMAAGQPWWFFSVFIVLKGLIDIGSLVPRWQYKPEKPPRWVERVGTSLGPARGAATTRVSFADHWRRAHARERERQARDEEVVDA